MTDLELHDLSHRLGEICLSQKTKLFTAESCTGGWIAKALTDVAGSSQWFSRGWITYENEAKEQLLGVHGETLREFGAVSEETVTEMALGAVKGAGPRGLSVAVSGIAGPGGGTEEKPVGTVWMAWSGNGQTRTSLFQFEGDREWIRRQAVAAALVGLLEWMSDE